MLFNRAGVCLVKRAGAPRTTKNVVATYAKDAKNGNAAEDLKARGAALDKKLADLQQGNEVRRILFNKATDQDLSEDMWKDTTKFAQNINKFAREGPHEFVQPAEKLKPVTVTVTGAAGQIAYALLVRIANGDLLGANQPIILRLLERPDALKALEGTVMELQDCAFPLLHDIIPTASAEEAFTNTDYAFLVGAKPRTKGMERGDLLKENAAIFAEQGKAINKKANADILTLVVGNPANTNALIASANARDVPKTQFSALTRLDHDRGLGMIAKKIGCNIADIERFCIWGNHSATMYPDLSHTLVQGRWLKNVIKDDKWIFDTFIPAVQQRGAAIINARGKSSAASAADASIKHMRDWVRGSSDWLSMAIYSDGAYGVPSGIFCSYPVKCFGAGEVGIIEGLPIDNESARRINISCDELLQEREAVAHLLPNPVVRLFEVDRTKYFSPDYVLGQK